jgi:hypothetical protein
MGYIGNRTFADNFWYSHNYPQLSTITGKWQWWVFLMALGAVAVGRADCGEKGLKTKQGEIMAPQGTRGVR